MSEFYRNLRVVGNDQTGELADIRISRERREQLKDYAYDFRLIFNVDELMFLAGALEDAARAKRGGGASL